MEAFNVLKFWRNSGTDTSSCRDVISELDDLDYIRNPVIETDEETDDDSDSFFDLVFTGPDRRPKLDKYSKSVSVNPESPRDVFFKPKVFPIDSSSKPQSPISILRSAPMFRVFFLGFRKTKPEKVSIDDSSEQTANIQTQKLSPKAECKRLTVSTVFTRDNSLRSKMKEEDLNVDESLKKFVRADMSKYLKLMKPLYARASKRYTSVSPSIQSICSPRKGSEEKQGNRVASFGAVRKHLRKSRSVESTVTGVSSSSPMKRRDDSLLQEQNDGIQGAILHCKRSYRSLAKGTCTDDSSEELNRWSI